MMIERAKEIKDNEIHIYLNYLVDKILYLLRYYSFIHLVNNNTNTIVGKIMMLNDTNQDFKRY